MILASPTPNTGNNATDYVIWVVAVILAVLIVLRRRQRRRQLGLPAGHRVVSLPQQWLDPIVIVAVSLTLLRRELSDPLHLLLGAIGLVVGAAAGFARARLIFVEARPDIRRVVIKRGVAEIAIVVAVLALTLLSRQFEHDRRSPLNLLATVVLTLGIAESLARVSYITWRYRRAAKTVGPASVSPGDRPQGSRLG